MEDDDEEDDEEEDGPSADGVDKAANGTVLKRKRKKKQKKSKGPNNWIYISGLPADISFEEIRDHFSKVSTFLFLCFSVHLFFCASPCFSFFCVLRCCVLLCCVVLCCVVFSFIFIYS